MKRLLAILRSFLDARSPRERWILALGGVTLIVLMVNFAVAQPLRARVERGEAQVARLQGELERAVRLARSVGELQTAVRQTEERIAPGEKTNLFTLLENIAEEARIKDRLESIKPKQPSTNALYPETRLEVSLKGATLEQTVKLLYAIDTAPAHLIIRSLRIKSRPDGSDLLDVSISVSSFERA